DELGVDALTGAPIIEVWNKIDCLDAAYREKLLAEAGENGPVSVSALTGAGVEQLSSRIDRFIAQHDDILSVRLPVAEGALLAKLYQMSEVLDRVDGEEAVIAEVRVSDKQRGPFRDLFADYVLAETDAAN
ncbi:MAG: GTPase HflX, partial [Pseudomonadota bacterium]